MDLEFVLELMVQVIYFISNITILNRNKNLLNQLVTNFDRACTTENRTYRV